MIHQTISNEKGIIISKVANKSITAKESSNSKTKILYQLSL